MSTPTAPRGIIGTAGHIDHGKTSLVRRLTGVDTDRLAEEKRRGITIALGFAPLTLPSGARAGVVDVPGHERFVKTMVAGANGVDVVLLVVAADEGVMPQTREHLDVCQTLGLSSGVIAMTKIDKVDPEMRALAEQDIREGVAGTFLEDAPLVACSAPTGDGVPDLLEKLERALEGIAPRPPTGPCLLPIDRCFTIKGFGSVVTGSLLRGQLERGDRLALLPNPEDRAPELRARGIQVFGADVDVAHAGQRTAVNVPGLDTEAVHPGQVLVRPGTLRSTRKVAVAVHNLAHRARPLRDEATVLFYVGTSQTEARVTLSGASELAPGESGYGILRLRQAIATHSGARFVLRSFEQSGPRGRTIGGGTIVDPYPVRRRLRSQEARDAFEAIAQWLTARTPDTLRIALERVLEERDAKGVTWAELALRLDTDEGRLRKAGKRSESIEIFEDRAVHATALQRLGMRTVHRVTDFHREQPSARAIATNELQSRVGRAFPRAVLNRALESCVRSGELRESGEGHALPDHTPEFTAESPPARRIREALAAGGLAPPTESELRDSVGLEAKSLKVVLQILVQDEHIVSAGDGVFFDRGHFERACRDLDTLFSERESLSPQDAKTHFGITRKHLIPLLETMDKHGFTVRVGNARQRGRRRP